MSSSSSSTTTSSSLSSLTANTTTTINSNQEKESQAHESVRKRNWSRAILLYDQILDNLIIEINQNSIITAEKLIDTTSSSSTTISPIDSIDSNITLNLTKDQQISCLLGRCECQLELGKYDNCINDAKRILKLLLDEQLTNECSASIARVRRRLVFSLYKLKRFQEAEIAIKEWINEASNQPSFADISKTLERYKTNIKLANNQIPPTTTGPTSLITNTTTLIDDEMSKLDIKLEHWATNNLSLDKYSKLLTNKGVKQKQQQRDSSGGGGTNSISSNCSTSSSSSGSSIGGNDIISVLQKPKSGGIQISTSELLANLKLTTANTENSDGSITCSYCAITLQDKNELRQHCQTENHQNMIMSDEGRDWKWRPPPRGYTLDSYILCESYSESQTCHYGNQCVEAHGLDELNEWKDRFEYRKMRLQRACEKELYGKSYTEELLEKWGQAASPDKVMCEKIDGIDVQCSNELVTSMSSKISKREWIFTLKTKKHLKAVALLQDAHRNHFSIKSIIPGGGELIKSISSSSSTTNTYKYTNNNKRSSINNNNNSNIKNIGEIELKSDQEWISLIFDKTQKLLSTTPTPTDSSTSSSTSSLQLLEHKIKISFCTDIFGTFRQSVCFDFGNEPVLVKHLCVDVLPVGDAEKIQEIKKDIINSTSQRWDDSNTNLVKFETTIGSHLKTEAFLHDQKIEKELLERYPCPRAATFTLTQSTIVDKKLTKNNYRSRIHELLYVEEIARYEQIARYNLTTKLRIASNYMLTPSGMATSTAKYSHSGELFGLMSLGKDVSEDTSAGRLILSNCTSVYLSQTIIKDDNNLKNNIINNKKRDIYEATIEDKGKNMIYLKLSAKCVNGLNLKSDTDFQVDIQFQLNRLSYCEWHNAVDKITDFRIIFPDTYIEPNIPWTPKKQWSDSCDPKLNAKQKEAVNGITTPVNCSLPPILLIGPFGTGKTYTLAQAIKQLLTQSDTRILICTHSNSAADLYIKDYLHPWVEKGMKEATPLRIYYHKRWVATVNQVVQKYSITDGAGNFRRPTVDDIIQHRIVVVTLNISMQLATLGLPKGFFTHIFLDEAAQAMECEAIMPLALASENTRIVLAGDHMQMSPELFSNFAKERKLHVSLLERLYDHYPSNFPCKILLCENYRAHEAIIKFTSELFYEQKLIASGKQPRHDRFYPLTFFTTRGEDVQDKNSTAFYNNSEVYEVVERVCELRKKWPSSWGKINDSSIGIMTPYADQVFRIRSELRKRRMPGISVERVLNVQGKQFRAIFLSTVRTRRTCMPNATSAMALANQNDDADYGFLSNSKLLNTAITRAQSLVAVVGDPVALCSIGRCRKVWERFIDICNQNKSLFGITWSLLRSQLDGVELKRSYVLNPLAPEFIPRSLQPEAYLNKQAAMYLMGSSGPVGNVSGIVGGGINQHQMPPSVHQQQNNQIPPMYGNGGNSNSNHPYGLMNQGPMGPMGGPQQILQKSSQIPGVGGHGQMPTMRQQPHGNQQQPPPPPPPYNLQIPPGGGQQGNLNSGNGGNGQQFSPYMIWPSQQQQQQQNIPPNQMMRSNYPPSGSGGGVPLTASSQPVQPPQNNPNATLWGPPPQTNPWVMPKPSPINPNIRGGVPMNMNMRPPPGGPPIPGLPPQSAQQSLGSMQQPPPPPPPQNPAASIRNPQDLAFLNKYLYQNSGQSGGGGGGAPGNNTVNAASNPLQNAGNFPNQSTNPMMMNIRNQLQNGPASPALAMQQAAAAVANIHDPSLMRPNNHIPNNVAAGGFLGPQQQAAAAAAAAALLASKEKDYQFLNNVHNIPMNLTSGICPITQQQSIQLHQNQNLPSFHDYSALLPPNMTFYDMAFEPKESQYKWYLRLLDIHGQDAANKFTEVLRQVMSITQNKLSGVSGQQMNQRPPSLMGVNTNPGAGGGGGVNLHTSNNMGGNSNTGGGGGNGNDNSGTNVNFNQQIDLVFNSLMNGNEISQPILRDLLGMVGTTGNVSSANDGGGSGGVNLNNSKNYSQQIQQQQQLHHQQQQQQQLLQQQQKQLNTSMIMQHQNNQNLLGNGTDLTSNAREQSVPLYRRQVIGGSNNSISGASNISNSSSNYHNSPSSNNQSISSTTSTDHLLDNSINSNGGSGGSGTSNNNLLINNNNNNNNNATATLIESLFSSSDLAPYSNVNSIQKLFYNYSLKQNSDCDLLMSGGGMGGNSTTGNNTSTPVNRSLSAAAQIMHQQHQQQNLHHMQQQQQQQQQQQHHHHHQQHQQQQQQQQQQSQSQSQHHNNPTVTTDRNTTTYAAVLSQGSSAPTVPTSQQQQHIHHHQQQHQNSHLSEDKDPFAAIRELGQRSNGFYNHFQ